LTARPGRDIRGPYGVIPTSVPGIQISELLPQIARHMRTRYGGNIFGQSCLLAWCLVEAGTRFVQVKWYGEPAWHGRDVHGANLRGLGRMETLLRPRLDYGLSCLLEDLLKQRGLLDSTLVVVTGEFGRTPRVNQYRGSDHWPQCFSVLLVGAGDNQAAYRHARVAANLPNTRRRSLADWPTTWSRCHRMQLRFGMCDS
jgi:hypothetical protein